MSIYKGSSIVLISLVLSQINEAPLDGATSEGAFIKGEMSLGAPGVESFNVGLRASMGWSKPEVLVRMLIRSCSVSSSSVVVLLILAGDSARCDGSRFSSARGIVSASCTSSGLP